MVTELVKDLFIPDAPMADLVPYRCIPRTMVVHINKVISSEQPDDSIPVLRRGESWDGEIAGFELKESMPADGARCVRPPDSFRAIARDPGEVSSSWMQKREANGRIFCPPVAGHGWQQSTTGRNWK
jgi:hypothetical protein